MPDYTDHFLWLAGITEVLPVATLGPAGGRRAVVARGQGMFRQEDHGRGGGVGRCAAGRAHPALRYGRGGGDRGGRRQAPPQAPPTAPTVGLHTLCPVLSVGEYK
jgi:hypothetical protein